MKLNHKMRWKKRGLSEIIATIAIVLLTVGAITLVVAFVVPFVRDNLNSSTECLDYKEYYEAGRCLDERPIKIRNVFTKMSKDSPLRKTAESQRFQGKHL